MLTVEGRTEDGRLVVGGVYHFYETHGIPLDALLSVLNSRDIVPSWVSFYQEARRAGMSPSRVLSMLEPHLLDALGAAYRDVVIGRLRRYIELVEKEA